MENKKNNMDIFKEQQNHLYSKPWDEYSWENEI